MRCSASFVLACKAEAKPSSPAVHHRGDRDNEPRAGRGVSIKRPSRHACFGRGRLSRRGLGLLAILGDLIVLKSSNCSRPICPITCDNDLSAGAEGPYDSETNRMVTPSACEPAPDTGPDAEHYRNANSW